MKKLNFVSLMIAALFMGLSFTSCEEDENILAVDDDDDTPAEWELTMAEGDEASSETVYVSDLEDGATTAEVTVTFTSTEGKMRRLYMTQNVAGAGAEKFELEIEGIDKKGDGSLDLSKNEKSEFKYKIPFPVLSNMTAGTVEYTLWATSGIGDYRDMDKRIVVGPGTITVNYGGQNPETVAVKNYKAILLAPPTADKSSESFISLIDGQVYPIEDGEEYVAYWDFGYYYGNTHKASLASTSDYPTSVMDIAAVANTTEELNNCYFAKSDWTTDDFDSVVNASELNDIVKPSEETVKDLLEGDVIEFVDNYGKKGLIKVLEIKPGFGSGDYIKLDIKVQP